MNTDSLTNIPTALTTRPRERESRAIAPKIIPHSKEGGLQAIVGASGAIPVPGQRNALHKSACLLTHWFEVALGTERVHFWRGPDLLTTLDEVVNAFLASQLEIEWTFILTGPFEEVEAQTRELRYLFRVVEEREEATGESWRRVLRTGRVRY